MSDLRKAAQQALDALEQWDGTVTETDWKIDYSKEIAALRAALAEHDKDRVRIAERKAQWAEQLQLARETQERDRQQREYEEQRLAALAEPEQEPVAWMYEHDGMVITSDNPPFFTLNRWATPVNEPYTETPLYTAPPQRKPLTADETMQLVNATAGQHWCDEAHLQRFRAAIERAHGITE